MRRWPVVAAVALAVCCSAAEAPPFARRSLSPGANPFDAADPLWSPQPRRDHPIALALSADERKLYVALQGSEDEPGSEVAVLDVAAGRSSKRIRVGSSPTALTLHPSGRYLVVTNRFSNFASVIDTERDEVVREIQVPFYTIDLAFTADGRRAYLTNRWKDSVLRWELDPGQLRVLSDDYSALPPDAPMGIAVGDNPRSIAIHGDRAYVASVTGLSLSILDLARGVEVRRVNLRAPIGDVRVARGRYVLLTHTGSGTQHPPDEGFDGDEDGAPGDGTANVMFQDLQNEIAVLDLDGNLLRNFTSDTICCADFRDVDPDHPEKGAALPAPDTWPASRLAFLPPRDTWIVAGALPESIAIAGDRAYVAYSGSNEVQGFAVGDGGALTPLQKRGALFPTGMNPAQLVLTRDGQRAFVAERLGEGVTILDLARGPGHEVRVPLSDETAPFPATDAELGEAINFVTAKLTVDGDQTCVHCHREGGNLAKAVAMPLQTSPLWGRRMVMAYRGAHDTRPWFFETAMTESNFFPVINELARKENFCCEQLDPLIWSKYPSTEACTAAPDRAGCEHVLHCRTSPPPECAARTYGSPHPTRNEHFLAGARALFGRDRTFGDALHKDIIDASGKPQRTGLLLDFDGVTRSLGLFLLARPRFFPNPNAAIDLPAARRGRALYESPTVGCNACHPLPLTTVTRDFNPFGVPLRFAPVISPLREPSGADADRVTPGFLQTFPLAEQDAAGVRFGVPQLRGIWDRARRFFHDGRARSLREALATPGHPALLPGETGFNETNGVFDTHGATSTLTATQLEELIAFLETL